VLMHLLLLVMVYRWWGYVTVGTACMALLTDGVLFHDQMSVPLHITGHFDSV